MIQYNNILKYVKSFRDYAEACQKWGKLHDNRKGELHILEVIFALFLDRKNMSSYLLPLVHF